MKSDNEILNVAIQLLKPRTIFTAMFFGAFLWGTTEGAIEPQYLVAIVTSLFGFWFGAKVGKAKAKNDK